MSSQLLPLAIPLQFTHVAPKSPHDWLPTVAHVPWLQHDVWHVPSPGPPQLPLQFPSGPHVGV
jgi:hypothetical protein